MQKRREFIKSFSRGVIFTGLISLSGYLLFREKEGKEKCDFDFICQNCKKLKSCTIPEAQKYRKENPLQP